jgi:phosphoglycolate phosphatase
MTTKLPKVILFDWDNTLVDTESLVLRSLNHTFSHFGLPLWNEQEVRKNAQHSGRESFPRYFGDQWQQAQEIFYHFYDTCSREGIDAIPGAESLLQTTQKLAIRCGVVSNKRGPALRQEIQYIGWQKYFATLIGAGDAARDKPAPDPILLALKQIGCESSEDDVWFVGDAPVDWQAAQAAGCCPIPLGFLHEEARIFPQAVANCHELEKILLRI